MSETQTNLSSAAADQADRQSGASGPEGGLPPNGVATMGPRRKTPNVRRRKTVARLIWTAVLLGVLAGIVIAVKIVFYDPPPQFFSTDVVRRVDKLTQQVTGWGYCAPVESFEVRSEVKGKVLESYGFEGMPVNEGDILCVLDSEELDKAIEDIDDEIEKQNQTIEDENKAIADITKEMNEANAEQIQQARDAALYAPFSGKILGVTAQTIGSEITKGKTLGTLVDDSVMVLRLYFSYGYINDIKTGMKASVSIPTSMSVVNGAVTNVEKIRNIQSDGTVTFEVEISINNPGALTKDMAATATMSTDSGETILPAGSGTLEYLREEIVSAGAGGNLKVFNLRNFHEYKKGDLLLQIEFIPDDSVIDGYLGNIETHKKIIEAAELAIEEKRTERAEQEALYEKLTVTAPQSGTILMFAATFDQIIDPSVVICNIAQMDRMVIEANIEQVNLQYFKVGMPVEVSEGYGDENIPIIPGTVKSVSLEGKNEYGYVTYPCKIEVDNSDGRLLNSYGVNFNAILAEAINPLIASIEVIKPLTDGECVFVKTNDRPENAIDLPEGVVPEGFYAVPVTVGITSRVLNTTDGMYMYEDVVEIKSGVEEGWELHRQKLNVKPSPSPSPSDDEGVDGPIDGGDEGMVPDVPEDGGDWDIIDPVEPMPIEPGVEEPGIIDESDIEPGDSADESSDPDASEPDNSDPDTTEETPEDDDSTGDSGDIIVALPSAQPMPVRPVPMPAG